MESKWKIIKTSWKTRLWRRSRRWMVATAFDGARCSNTSPCQTPFAGAWHLWCCRVVVGYIIYTQRILGYRVYRGSCYLWICVSMCANVIIVQKHLTHNIFRRLPITLHYALMIQTSLISLLLIRECVVSSRFPQMLWVKLLGPWKRMKTTILTKTQDAMQVSDVSWSWTVAGHSANTTRILWHQGMGERTRERLLPLSTRRDWCLTRAQLVSNKWWDQVKIGCINMWKLFKSPYQAIIT